MANIPHYWDSSIWKTPEDLLQFGLDARAYSDRVAKSVICEVRSLTSARSTDLIGITTSGDAWQYYGSTHEWQPHGYGIKVYEVGGYYAGMWQGGLPHGRWHFQDSTIDYKGDFQKGIYDGFGALIQKKQMYTGHFSEGCYHGLGILKFLDHGWEYIGNFTSWEKTGSLLQLGQEVIAAGMKSISADRISPRVVPRFLHLDAASPNV